MAPLRRGFFVAGRVAGPSLGIGCRFGLAWRAGPATFHRGRERRQPAPVGDGSFSSARGSPEKGLHVLLEALVACIG